MSWLSYQRIVRDSVLAAQPDDAGLAALADDRFRVYRRLARGRFYETLEHGFERLIAVAGRDAFRGLVDEFLSAAPPRSAYLRDLPGELLAFVAGRSAALVERHHLPPFAVDLMRFEWAELDAAYSHEEARPEDVVALDMHLEAVLSSAHRLLELGHPVHLIDASGGGAPAAPSPVYLCVYRDPATLEVETLELTRVAARILAAIGRREAPLAEVVRRAALAEGASVDFAFVDALSTLLADLVERGLLLGSRRSPSA